MANAINRYDTFLIISIGTGVKGKHRRVIRPPSLVLHVHVIENPNS